MALRFTPLANLTGPAGLVQQPVTPEQSVLARKLMEARRLSLAPDTPRPMRAAAQQEVGNLESALIARKDQSRLNELPAGPLPPPGDVTIVEKGAVQERPPSSFGTLATGDQIREAFQRRQQQMAPPETMVAEATTPIVKPQAPAPQPTAVDMANMQGGAPAPAPAPQPAMAYQPPAQPTGGVSFAPNTEQRGISLGANAAMQKLEHSWGRPFTVTSAYRSPEHNAKVGGAKHSQHLHGNAFDISTKGWSEEDRQSFVDQALAAGFNGIGVYPNSLHIDVGSRRAWGPSYGSDSAPEWAVAKVNGAPVTDNSWITGAPPMAYNAENTMTPQGDPQSALMALLAAQQPQQPMPYSSPDWVPLQQAAPRTELAQAAPIAQGGRQVAFTPQVASPDQIDAQGALGAAMLARAQRSDAAHPMQALGNTAQAAAGAFGMQRARHMADARQGALAAALMAARGGGSLDQLYGVDPRAAFELDQQRIAAEAEARQAQLQRQWEMEDYARKKQIDRQYAAPPEPPTSVQEYEYGQANPEFADRQIQLKQAGRTSVTVNPNGTPSYDDTIRETAGKEVGKVYGNFVREGFQAQQDLGSLNQLRQSLGNIDTGGYAALRGWANDKLGLGLGEDADDLAVVRAITARLAPQARVEGSGATSDFEAGKMIEAFPMLSRTPGGNEIIMNTLESMARFKMQQGELVQRYLSGNDPEIQTQLDLGQAVSKLGNPMEYFDQWERNIGRQMLRMPKTISAEDQRSALETLRRSGYDQRAAAEIQQLLDEEYGAQQ